MAVWAEAGYVRSGWRRVWLKRGLNDAAGAASRDTPPKPPLFFGCRGQHHAKGSPVELNQAGAKELLQGEAGTQPQADAPGVSGNDRADFEKAQPDGFDLSTVRVRTA